MRVAPVLVLVACARTQPETPAPVSPPATADADAPVEPCDDLAQRYCEALSLPCARVRALIVAAAIEPSRCAAVDGELASLRAGAGPDAYTTAAAESLQRLLDASALDIDEVLDERPTEPIDLACPSDTAKKQRARRAWCEGSDGLPHGPFAVWNARGELVQEGSYDRGRVIDPGYLVPESRDVPWDAFDCPHGTSARSRVDADEKSKWCERPDGTLHGPSLAWRDGLVMRFAVYEDGRETKSFSVSP